jgi:hypothetical protein
MLRWSRSASPSFTEVAKRPDHVDSLCYYSLSRMSWSGVRL